MTTFPAVTGADSLVSELGRAGVEIAFGLPGVHNLPVWRAIARSEIRLVGVRHEQAAAYAADGYARATGRVSVALTTTGPGAANAITATGEAWASGSPIVVIATGIPTRLRRDGVYRGVLHETRDQAGMFRPVTKETFEVSSAEAIGRTVQAAIATAMRAPTGPVYVEIPMDLLGADVSGIAPDVPDQEPAAEVDRRALARAVEMIDGASAPLIWAGGGATRAGAGPAVSALARRIGAPVLETFMGRGVIAPDDPAWVGAPPHVPQAGRLWDEADLVIVVGSDLDGMMTQNWRMPAPRQMLAVNIDPVDAVKNYDATVVVGDARDVCELLATQVARQDATASSRWQLERLRAAVREDLQRDAPSAWAFLQALAEGTTPDTFICVDMCIPGYWTGGFHPFAEPRRLGYPVGWGTLGFGFPASLGAAVSGTGPTLCICGDGGFLFACGELATVAQEQIPLTILLVDDGGYGVLRYDQLAAGDEPFGVDLQTPDWIEMATAFGIAAERVPSICDLGATLERHLADERPSLLLVEESLKPPVTTSARWYRPPRP